ncbi:radical SAM protein [Geomonas azotofigens]|uniref:radical SAM protein n=1 Tax=Geomonas azotofigens TaxID=2843196 RepID=UPI001C11CA06|nr:radical SAM protein [Geomonas azotofigens]MBU5613854.1 radical SAM protein [Geomonas azotofigens]
MKTPPEQIIRETQSVCPVCLAQLPAVIYETRDGEVHMSKECPVHGPCDVYLWPDAERYRWHAGMGLPSFTRAPQTDTRNGCPLDCGLCPGHERSITLPEVEVTWRCNLSCPVCFMFDGEVPADPSLEELQSMFASIVAIDGQNLPIQLTGGEPTVRDDLDEVIRLARRCGLVAVELNTNGLVIGRDRDYLRRLKDAGLTDVYLQLDGLDPETTVQLRGRDVFAGKMQAIENCRAEGIPVVLSVAVVSGVNDGELGGLIRFCMDNLDVVKGLALQPAFHSGRFEVGDAVRRLSLADVAQLVSRQSRGRIEPGDFWPVASSHPLCYGSTFLVGKGEDYHPFTRGLGEEEFRSLLDRRSPQGAAYSDVIAGLTGETGSAVGLPILIMEYMDAWTMDLERARGCNLAVTVADGRAIPFCVYHLTDAVGNRLHPHGGRGRHGRCA